ncbi:MAG: CAP domain-containing protein [Treponema sp.]|jgi:hypothetical protein|nr:CAP domain-containing protein [Treponema sp.]
MKGKQFVRGVYSLLMSCVVIGGGAAEDWDIALLDTARTAHYLTAIEKDVVLELNKVRSDPRKYAERYIRPRLAYFEGNRYAEPGKTTLLTNEGPGAVQECYDALCSSDSAPLLIPSQGMSSAVKDHVLDQGPTGATGHNSSNGASFSARLNRYGKWSGSAAENIAYGKNTGREIVVQLLIDDGVPSRGHRKNTMGKSYNVVGVAAGNHSRYGTMAVIDFASTYTE